VSGKPVAAGGTPIVEAYLAAVAAQDWAAFAACLAPDVERIGPYGDNYRGRDEYVAFLRDLMPKLPGYRMDVDRVAYLPGGRLAVAELSETVEVDGKPLRTPEALVFDLDGDGRVARVAIYLGREPA
jgi:uncharacterized protein (TIGR02246 family)